MGRSETRATVEEQHNHRLLSILDISREMNAERDPSALLKLMAEGATRLMEADRASIFLLDRQNSELLSQVALGSSDELRFDARLGIAGAAAMNDEVINVANAQDDPRFYPQIDALMGYHTRSVLAVPMRNQRGDVIGTFEVLNKIKGSFTLEDEEVLIALAKQAAIAMENASRFQRLELENTELRRQSATQNLLGTSRQIQRIVRLIDTISDSSVTVLIRGESGTGKELVARAIHLSSPRANGPFVAVNSAALPENLVESELFGIEKGVATGVQARIGKFEEAHQGTLFLDEIGDLSLTAQAKILRVLQEEVIQRIGGRKNIPVDVRVVAATHRDLENAIKRADFREDLYYRLKVVEIRTPALRDIRQDIPLLARHFLNQNCRRHSRQPKVLSQKALQRLQLYDWPGNVRQLENEMARVAVSVRRREVEAQDLSVGEPESGPGEFRSGETLKEVVNRAVTELEKKMISRALSQSGNNQAQAARILGLSRQGLIKKMKRYGLK